MSTKPKISIIVPIYNVEQYLRKCIESLINQTLKEIEVILVDDGSPDNCPQICDEYAQKDERIKVIHKQNAGVSAARNSGIEIATGEWLAFVDADDWVEENIYEEAYKRTLEGDPDLVLFNFFYNYKKCEMVNENIPKEDFITMDSQIIEKLRLSLMHPFYAPYDSKFASMAAPWNKIFKASIVKEKNIKFPVEVKGVFDDGLFNLYYYDYVKKVNFFNMPLYHYRILSTSMLNKYKANRLEINELVFKKIEEYMKEKQVNETFHKAYYARIVTYLSLTINVYFFSKDNPKKFNEIMKELKQTANLEPYKTAINQVDKKYVGKTEGLYCNLLKHNMIFFTFVLYKIKKILEDYRGKKQQ